jgi:hypothetical protein
MKTFVAIYLGTAEALQRSGWSTLDEGQRRQREREGIEAWTRWGEANKAAIVDGGSPLGRTKQVSVAGMRDTRNDITGYTIVRASTHEEAARLFLNHPHFTIFPGDSVEIIECLPIPQAQD